MNSFSIFAMTAIGVASCAAKTVQPSPSGDPSVERGDHKCSRVDAWLCEADDSQDGYVYVCVMPRLPVKLPNTVTMHFSFLLPSHLDPGGQSGTFGGGVGGVMGISIGSFQVDIDGTKYWVTQYEFNYTPRCTTNSVSLELMMWYTSSGKEVCELDVAGWQTMLQDCIPSDDG